MDTIDKIRNMVMTDSLPDTIIAKEKDDLVILNYSQEVQFNNLWTDIEIACRGLMINKKTGEIVARPFDKFFNWGENDRKTDAKIKRITEKMDGSLGILVRLDGRLRIATKKGFSSHQSKWATDFLNSNYSLDIYDPWTLLFEIIYPENRIVIDYDGFEGLVLLAIRDRFTGKYIPHKTVEEFAKVNKFSLPTTYSYSGVDEIIDLCGEISQNMEGWVVEFEDGQRFKFKGSEYMKIHKLISGLSFKFVLENHQAGTLNQALEIIPDEFKDEVNGWTKEIEDTIQRVFREVNEAFRKAPKANRKEFAFWCMENVPNLTPYMFLKLDGRDILPVIYKCAFL